jgi:hypothetical protein
MAYLHTKNAHLGIFLDGLGMQNVGIFYCYLFFYGRLVYFVVISYFFPFLYVVPRKIWQPCPSRIFRNFVEKRGIFCVAEYCF